MCGIVCIIRRDGNTAVHQVEKQYQKQKARGQEGFGFVSFKKNLTASTWRQATDEAGILKQLRQNREASIVLFHHRNPTSAPNFIEATHPIEVVNNSLDYNYYLVHNGTISNADKLFKKHIALGFEYSTLLDYYYLSKKSQRQYAFTPEISGAATQTGIFNDSEALAIEVARYLDGKAEKIDTEGTAAFVCFQVERATNKLKAIYCGRNATGTLSCHLNNHFMSLSSEGKGEQIKPHILHTIDPITLAIIEKPMTMGIAVHGGFQRWDYDRREYVPRDNEFKVNPPKESLESVAQQLSLVTLPSITPWLTGLSPTQMEGYVKCVSSWRLMTILQEEVSILAHLIDDNSIDPAFALNMSDGEWEKEMQGIKAILAQKSEMESDLKLCQAIRLKPNMNMVWVSVRLANLVDRYAAVDFSPTKIHAS